MTKEQQEAETLNQEIKYYEGIMKGLSISKVLLSEGKMTNHNIEVEMDRYSTELMHRYQVQDALSCISDPPTALDLISAERDKQISKGYTVEHDAKYVGETYIHFDQLAFGLMNRVYAPEGWDKKYWEELTKLPLKEKLAIAGSWIATELDIVLHKEKTEQ